MYPVFKNNATSKLANAISANDYSLKLLPGTGVKFPTLSNKDEYFSVTVATSEHDYEIMKVYSVRTDTLSIRRGQEGTTPKAFPVGATVEQRLTSEDLRFLTPTALQVHLKADATTDISGHVQLADDAFDGTNLAAPGGYGLGQKYLTQLENAREMLNSGLFWLAYGFCSNVPTEITDNAIVEYKAHENTNYVTQYFYVINQNRVFYRTNNGYDWHPLQEIPTKFDGTPVDKKIAPGGYGLGTTGNLIADAVSLDTIKTTGFYNTSSFHSEFIHAVILVIARDVNFTRQILFKPDQTIAVRMFVTNAWTPWVEVPTGVGRLGVLSKRVSDWNTATENGWYTARADSTNGPDTTATWYYIEVNNSDARYLIQKAIPFGAGAIHYTRRKESNVWKPWIKVPVDLDAVSPSNKIAPGGFGLGSGSAVVPENDCNKMVMNGWYNGSNVANGLPGWHLYEVKAAGTTAPNRLRQFAYPFAAAVGGGTGYRIYTRWTEDATNSAVWSPWIQLPSGITDSISTVSSSIAASATAVKVAYERGSTNSLQRIDAKLVAGTTTWTVPDHNAGKPYYIYVWLIGGGAGGSGAFSGVNGGSSGSGGGAGGSTMGWMRVTPGKTVVITVGAGGAGGPAVASTARRGANGGSTSFGPFATAHGGTGSIEGGGLGGAWWDSEGWLSYAGGNGHGSNTNTMPAGGYSVLYGGKGGYSQLDYGRGGHGGTMVSSPLTSYSGDGGHGGWCGIYTRNEYNAILN